MEFRGGGRSQFQVPCGHWWDRRSLTRVTEPTFWVISVEVFLFCIRDTCRSWCIPWIKQAMSLFRISLSKILQARAIPKINSSTFSELYFVYTRWSVCMRGLWWLYIHSPHACCWKQHTRVQLAALRRNKRFLNKIKEDSVSANFGKYWQKQIMKWKSCRIQFERQIRPSMGRENSGVGMLQLRRIDAGFSQRRHGFNPRQTQATFILDEVGISQSAITMLVLRESSRDLYIQTRDERQLDGRYGPCWCNDHLLSERPRKKKGQLRNSSGRDVPGGRQWCFPDQPISYVTQGPSGMHWIWRPRQYTEQRKLNCNSAMAKQIYYKWINNNNNNQKLKENIK